MRNLIPVNVPKLKEFHVKEIWENIKDDKSINIYFRSYPKATYPSHTFFWNVL